ncbi:ATP-binding protein [Microbacterium sp. BK668]|uniref:sensor histidine kinase n=1 Tax=Microbacterium sp. BK668 TaxID=2512118 RepID=UPI00105F8204|nr:ATP-binding protein [Microbacterium sp. BK668]TDN93124.1 phospho-acceptor domain-containing protein [Microbacterium sp. BK668]
MASATPTPARGGGFERTLERTVLLNQLLFGGVVLLGVLLIVVTGVVEHATSFAMGTLLAFFTTGAAMLVPWNRLPALLTMLVPAVDVAVIGLLAAASPETGLEVLWVFPAMWFGAGMGAAGVGVASGLISVSYWTIVASEPMLSLTPSVVLLPLAMAAVAATSHLSARRASAHRLLLERQSQQLRQSVERARRQEDLITDVLDAVDFGVVRIRDDGSLVVTNEANARMQRASERARTAYEADGITPLPEERLPLARARRGELFEDELVWYGRPGDDRRRAQRSTARRVFDTDLDPVGTIVVTRDVTAEELALRAREDLVASVSHELRTPLTSITGYVELALENEELPSSARRNLEVAQRNAERLLSLVADILSASAVSRRGIDLSIDRVRTDLAAVVQAAIEAAEPRAAERRITIDSSGIEEGVAFADPHRIRQVVDNLLSNAIKYGREDGHIAVGTTQDDAHVWIVVRDDGPGIPPQELPRLFERFFRSDAVRNTTIHGSGLGLAISRDIARAHGGEITVQSTPEKGSTFVVRLPASNGNEDAG